MIKTLVIERHDHSGNITATTIYGVLPSDSLRTTLSQANSTVDISLSFRVVQIFQSINGDVVESQNNNVFAGLSSQIQGFGRDLNGIG